MWFCVYYVTCTIVHRELSQICKKKPVPPRIDDQTENSPFTQIRPKKASTVITYLPVRNQWNYVLIHKLTAGIMQLLLALIVTVVHQVSCQKKPNNVCPTYRDYFNMLTNSKCWYDFAAEMTVVSPGKPDRNPVQVFKFSSRKLLETPAILSSLTKWGRGTISIWRCFGYQGFVRTNPPFLCCTGCRAPRGFL